MSQAQSQASLQTPLDALHRELGAKMVPFAGYDMPLQYPAGILAEHRHTRAAAGLFDVSHMGQVVVRGPGVAEALEALLPVDVLGLEYNSQVYALLTNDSGGVLDDLIITRWNDDEFFLVVNAARKEQDVAHLRAGLPGIDVEVLEDRALLALQGPAAREVMAQFMPGAERLTFMRGSLGAFQSQQSPAGQSQTGQSQTSQFQAGQSQTSQSQTSQYQVVQSQGVYVTCSGYTGEDGFEISLPASQATAAARELLAHSAVQPIGLGARDSLRLEAGLCLYGHELTEQTTPVAAGLMWSVSKPRRSDGERAGGFPGARAIFAEQSAGPRRRRVGLLVDGKRPVRDGQAVLSDEGAEVGVVTSACFGATVAAPIAMAYVGAGLREPGTRLSVDVRGKPVPVTVSKMPFVPQRYYRG